MENIKETLCNVTNSSIFALIIVINSAIKGVRLQSTVRLQPYTMIGEKYSSQRTNQIWGNCNGYD